LFVRVTLCDASRISRETIDEFDTLISEARKQAERAGMKQSDITSAIASVRG
jgi:hypothetical protein